jgi:hypothetical protein
MTHLRLYLMLAVRGYKRKEKREKHPLARVGRPPSIRSKPKLEEPPSACFGSDGLGSKTNPAPSEHG